MEGRACHPCSLPAVDWPCPCLLPCWGAPRCAPSLWGWQIANKTHPLCVAAPPRRRSITDSNRRRRCRRRRHRRHCRSIQAPHSRRMLLGGDQGLQQSNVQGGSFTDWVVSGRGCWPVPLRHREGVPTPLPPPHSPTPATLPVLQVSCEHGRQRCPNLFLASWGYQCMTSDGQACCRKGRRQGMHAGGGVGRRCHPCDVAGPRDGGCGGGGTGAAGAQAPPLSPLRMARRSRRSRALVPPPAAATSRQRAPARAMRRTSRATVPATSRPRARATPATRSSSSRAMGRVSIRSMASNRVQT